MNTHTRFASAAGLLLLALLLSACGDPPAADNGANGDNGDAAILPPGQTPSQTAVDVALDDGQTQSSFRLICDDVPRFEGDSGERDAGAACDALDAAAERLAELNDPDREPEMCTEIYGGPHTAQITGTLNDTAIDVTVTRSNGCGISDWDRLEALLGKASNDWIEPVQ